MDNDRSRSIPLVAMKWNTFIQKNGHYINKVRIRGI